MINDKSAWLGRYLIPIGHATVIVFLHVGATFRHIVYA